MVFGKRKLQEPLLDNTIASHESQRSNSSDSEESCENAKELQQDENLIF